MSRKTGKKVFGTAFPTPWKPPALPKPAQPQTLKPAKVSSNYPRKSFEPLLTRPIKLDYLATEVVFRLRDADGEREIKSCYGDIYKVINALMDYARLLELSCDEWDLQGYHRAIYELQAEKLRAIAKKYQESIGYDYDAAVARCEAKRKKKRKDDDIGGEALELFAKRGQKKSDKKEGD